MTAKTPDVNRQWTVVARPQGKVRESDFALREQPFSREVALKEGEILLDNRMFMCAPVMRGFLDGPGNARRVSIPIGAAMIGPVGSEVIASNNPDFPVGTFVETVGRWEDYSVVDPGAGRPVHRALGDMTIADLMGPLSTNALTAYFGILNVAQVKAGDTVVVTAAAGSVGMMACQFAKLQGARVIAVAGGKEKCDWTVDTLKVDAAIDYKSEDVGARLAELCPDGVDVHFDNVGGDIAQAVIDNIAPHGRIAVCGQVSTYDGDGPAPGPRDMMKIVYWRVRIEGFTINDWHAQFDEARERIHRWFKEGKLVSREDVRHGFEALPATFLDLFEGRNNGSLIVAAD